MTIYAALTRRHLLGIAATSVGVALLAACGSQGAATAAPARASVSVAPQAPRQNPPSQSQSQSQPASQTGTTAQGKQTPGYVTGTVLNSQGKPIANGTVTVAAGGTSQADVKVSNRTLADPATGQYKIHVTDVIDRSLGTLADGRYTISAEVAVRYNGNDYRIRIPDASGESLPGDITQGIVRHFRWQIAGQIPGTAGTPLFFGATLRVQDDGASTGKGFLYTRYPHSKLTYALTARGPRIDGSPGESLTRTIEDYGVSVSGDTIKDIPVGAYTLVATLIDMRGGSHPLQVRRAMDQASVYSQSCAIDFLPGTYQSGLADLLLQVKDA